MASSSHNFHPSSDEVVTVVVLGASGDLAHKKTYPSLYDLFIADLLPKKVTIIGFARSAMPDETFRNTIRGHLKGGSDEKLDAFLQLCIYRQGKYDDAEAFKKVADEATALEDKLGHSGRANRMFYFAIPPSVFVQSAASIHAGAMTTRGWNRMVVEKPFGRDSSSSEQLAKDLAKFFTEDQIYRIDHYLGKEMVQNLMVLRFANAVFEPLWNARSIANVQITFKEPFGTEGRGGYFDDFGIIRDVMQNHLLQVLSLVAMETPVSMRAEDVRDEKVKVLKCVAPVAEEDVVLGQYVSNAAGTKPGYLDDSTVPKGSVTPTFATAVLHVNNPRWRGVPFILKCGKALNERKAEIRIQFRAANNGLFGGHGERLGVGQAAAAHSEMWTHNNELVLRIQPNEAVYLKMMSKVPGLEFAPVETDLSLSYKSRYPTRPPPEAYARLLLDVFRGDQSQFVRSDELSAAWKIFTPLLHKIEAGLLKPLAYPYGSRGPPQSDKLVAKYGYNYEGRYAGEWRRGNEPAAEIAAAVKTVRDEFSLSKDRLVQILNNFIGEMKKGLDGEPSTIKMIPSFVTALPSGSESGSVWAIDMGGSNLRVVRVDLAGGSQMTIGSEFKAAIPQATMNSSAEVLFDFIADCCVKGGMKDGDTVGFTFSFPVNQTGIDAGTLMEWTKGFTAPGVVGNEVVALLQAALVRKALPSVRISALVNDTVGTLMAAAYSDTEAKIGVILGTGTNAAYAERSAKIGKWHGSKDGLMLINMEWGGFGSSGDHAFWMLPFHGVDHALDAESPNEGKQRYEKMIAGMYLGELTRLLLAQLSTAGALFVDPAGPASPSPSPSPKNASSTSIHRPWGFTTSDMAEIAEDATPELSRTGELLADRGQHHTSQADRRLVQEVCGLVAKRAARLAAVGVAAVVTQMGDDGLNCHCAIDGSVYKKYPHFKAWMEEALVELGLSSVQLTFAEDGSGKGAAVTAVVAAKSS